MSYKVVVTETPTGTEIRYASKDEFSTFKTLESKLTVDQIIKLIEDASEEKDALWFLKSNANG